MKIEINQIYYNESQKPFLQSGWIPYNNSKALPPNNFEYSVFITNFLSGNITADLTGFLSWKFKAKTGISGAEFANFITMNPGYDVYFVNPFPQQSCFKNVWLQGNYFHPNLIQITKKLLLNAGYCIDILSFENRLDTLCYCNYWVGSKIFWKKYIEFILPLYNYLNDKASSDELLKINVKADKSIDAPYSPFIFERMFSTFLALNPDLKVCSYEYDKEQIQQKFPKISKRLTAMYRANKNKNSVTYLYHRYVLYFRLYGIRRIPYLVAMLQKWKMK